MILVWLILILIAGGVVAGLVGNRNPQLCRWIALVAVGLDMVLALSLVSGYLDQMSLGTLGIWLVEWSAPWVPQFGITFHFAVDGLSLLMIVLNLFLGLIGIGASWKEIQDRVGFFHFNFLFILAGVIGVFTALDLFLFFFFWEIMLVPMYLLIGIWGHENRQYAAVKFFVFTQVTGLLMLLSILALVFHHQQTTGVLTFDYTALLGTNLAGSFGFWVMLGFFVAFATKLPAFPFHPWLPDAHTEAPTAGSIILAGILLKTGAYGLLRFVIPLFPEAALDFTTIGMSLGVIGVLYTAVLAFAQTDLKRLVAYTSVSHMGFVLMGIFAGTKFSLMGVVLQMICHGLSAGAQFMLVGALYERIHTRDMRKMGGLWTAAPGFGVAGLFFAMASLGLPGLGNFVAEFLILVGCWQVSPTLTIIATIGLVFATVYSLRFMQGAFYGPNENNWSLADLNIREKVLIAGFAAGLVWLGVYPQPVLNVVHPALMKIQPAGLSNQTEMMSPAPEVHNQP